METTENSVKAFGYAAKDISGELSPFNFSRRKTGDEDVRLRVLYCGICHSDLHSIKNHWFNAKYPMIPGYASIYNVGRKTVSGSFVGGIKETQEMIAFAAKHKITADIELIPMDYVNKAMQRIEKSDVRYRFVIDVGHTLKLPDFKS